MCGRWLERQEALSGVLALAALIGAAHLRLSWGGATRRVAVLPDNHARSRLLAAR